jgi:tetratricopeptide (TPR) repeat protein
MQPDISQEKLLSSSAAVPDRPVPEGVPKTPYAILLAVITVIGTYSWFFKMWDESDFPEILFNATYWIWLCLLLLIAGIAAALLRVRGRRFDALIVGALFAASIGSLGFLILLDRKAQPSDNTFTVVLFTFTDHTSGQNLGTNLRDNIKHQLETNYANDVLVLERNRELKGETTEDKASEARKWGTRRSGCHLAVWAELRTDPNQHYAITLHSATVAPFGPQINPNETSDYADLKWNVDMAPVGSTNAISNETIEASIRQIRLLYGLARFDRGDYLGAVKVLSAVGFPSSEYFAGRAAYRSADESKHAGQMFREAENHYRRCIALEPNESYLLWCYLDLGYVYNLMLAYATSEFPSDDAKKGIDFYSKAAEIYAKAHDQPNVGLMLTKKATILVNLYQRIKTEDESAAGQALNEAESDIHDALSKIDAKSENYSEAEHILGVIYDIRHDYAKAIQADEAALSFNRSKFKGFETELRLELADAQTHAAWVQNKPQLYEQGLANYKVASEGCPPISQSIYCYRSHFGAGLASFNWANRKTSSPGSPDWTSAMQRAREEFELSVTFVSRTEQVTSYAYVKQWVADANTELGSVVRGAERSAYFKAALTALTEAIEALIEAHRDTETLLNKRAECYQRLADDLPESSQKQDYLRLAQQDRDNAKGLLVESSVN